MYVSTELALTKACGPEMSSSATGLIESLSSCGKLTFSISKDTDDLIKNKLGSNKWLSVTMYHISDE